MLTVAIVVLVIFCVWIGTGAIEGFMDAQKRPTEKMEWCYKHGFFRQKHVLQFAETTVCPRCYHEAFKKVEK